MTFVVSTKKVLFMETFSLNIYIFINSGTSVFFDKLIRSFDCDVGHVSTLLLPRTTLPLNIPCVRTRGWN